ncbi:glycosyltransferase [Bacillus cereus group sp. BfR-BA-01516]|uniref:glycosyltransferase n=1 Tax=Bacillus cereus group sp. BfR-BA-01516 TaxID=2920366 RepID=UPI001F56AD54|nr:glycosyltransferase [Bacillus cereus group sp. BfR-BA-01516]
MISVIMLVYNAAPFLKDSICSILNQTEKDFELIIINDGSTDDSEEIINSFNDARIVYYKQENKGISSARNKGLEVSKGEFIAFQDADDISLPIRLENLKEKFVIPDIGIVHSDILIINEKDNAMGYWHAYNIERTKALRFFIKMGMPMNGPSIMVRKEAFYGLKYDESLSIGEDNNMICKIMDNWEAYYIPEPLYLYRRHTTNTTIKKMSQDYLMKLIESYPIEQLVPEIDWNHEKDGTRANAILAYFLFNRGVVQEAKQLLQNALMLSKGRESQIFVQAMANLILKNYDRAVELFLMYPHKDHIIENYIGETFGFAGELNEAKEYFLKALQKKGDYIEPLENLKGIGGKEYINLLDYAWKKFKI